MTIQNTETKARVKVIIERASIDDFKLIKKNKEFGFKWDHYRGKEVYKLQIEDDKKIQGLMCIFDHIDPNFDAIEIELLESCKENIGSNKIWEGVAGCLIAYACRESITRGHQGYVFLTPKTSLIKHYQAKYYLYYTPPIGLRMEGMLATDENIAIKLIKEYL